ncbi:Hypothetical protein NTJ_07039 [Nesidiocoris tenuis]|uniref:Uncharacterized protein n=1 Tax=Nesidiocoris tenuis TaxID=355587 RepID=A0ABN7ATG8_9HEMI|nr:Hypothetical protein NTJ_07039 [Nesidiocoris tenuis]
MFMLDDILIRVTGKVLFCVGFPSSLTASLSVIYSTIRFLEKGGKLSGLENSTRHPAKVQTSREKGANTQRTGLQQTDDLDRPSSERVTAEKKLFRNTTDTGHLERLSFT